MKKILLISCVLLTLLIGIYFVYYNNKEYEIIESSKQNNTIVNSNALTMMYETEAESGEYVVSTDTTWPQEGYIFNETLSKCENGGTLSWDSNTNRVVMQSNKSDRCYVYFDAVKPMTLAEYVINEVYTEDGVNGLYYHDGVGSYTNANQEAGENSYRYTGANPNNYVCFGSNEAPCPADNLYRIIGVFNGQVKLIKDDFATSTLLGTDGAYNTNTYSASSYPNYSGSIATINTYTGTNTWSESELNTVNLNQNYLNSLGTEWSKLIENHTWQVGGAAYANIYNSPVQTAYNYEVGANTANTTYQAKIGLMYVSDYGYAASPENWSTNMGSLNNDTNRNNNWMYMGLDEWTITDRSDYAHNAFEVDYTGNVDHFSYRENTFNAVRPSFYLNSDVQYISGTGTQSDPFRIA